MSFIQREIDRIRSALVADPSDRELLAAQQALCWALEPCGVQPPFRMIRGSEEEPEDCLARIHPPLSSDTFGHSVALQR